MDESESVWDDVNVCPSCLKYKNVNHLLKLSGIKVLVTQGSVQLQGLVAEKPATLILFIKPLLYPGSGFTTIKLVFNLGTVFAEKSMTETEPSGKSWIVARIH